MGFFKKIFGSTKGEDKEAGRGKKVLIIGLDGVPYSFLKQLIDEGFMPHTKALVSTGTLCRMDTSIPEVSSVAWTTFMTGVNPGKHGIYGFMDLRPGTYDRFFPDFRFVKRDTFWEIIGRTGNGGKRSIVINVPSTYPARELNGILISGFVAIDLKKATYPDTYVPFLEGIGYRLDVDATKARKSMDLFAEDIRETLTKREEVFKHFIEREEWDLFIATISETDRLHHFLWAASDDPSHPYHGFFIEIYRWIDRIIGELCGKVDEDTAIFLVSDHGFTHIRSEVYLSRWLYEEGYLKFVKYPPESHRDIAKGTRAFCLDPARIYINLKGKYPAGSVEGDGEFDALREEIRDKLYDLKFNGEKVVKRVYYGEEIFHGPEFANAPHLVVVPNYGFDFKGALNKDSVFGKSIFTGMHTRDDALFFINREIGRRDVNIVDLAPTILKETGWKEEQDFDGSIL